MTHHGTLCISGFFTLAVATAAQAGIADMDDLLRSDSDGVVFENSPIGVISSGSDTAFRNLQGEERWQLLADNVMLAATATIRRVTWWGAYDLDNAPESETMRVRFYAARPDGLPGDVILEESFSAGIRSATGEVLAASVAAREFIYEADLSAPITLDAGLRYWLEFTQIGDVDSAFRLEQALGKVDGFALLNQNVSDWTATAPVLNSDLAIALSTVPEPSSSALFMCCFAVLLARRRKRKAGIDVTHYSMRQ